MVLNISGRFGFRDNLPPATPSGGLCFGSLRIVDYKNKKGSIILAGGEAADVMKSPHRWC